MLSHLYSIYGSSWVYQGIEANPVNDAHAGSRRADPEEYVPTLRRSALGLMIVSLWLWVSFAIAVALGTLPVGHVEIVAPVIRAGRAFGGGNHTLCHGEWFDLWCSHCGRRSASAWPA